VEAIVSATVNAFGRLDILVPNAGVGAYGPFLELAPAFLEEMIDVNVKGTLYAVRSALPHLLESGEADIVTVASEAVLTRPRNFRILETAFRPMTEASWG
jgi:3-oxoacyl-[acyl-carrier protein] reductase